MSLVDVSFNKSISSKEEKFVDHATNEGQLASQNIIDGKNFYEISHDGPEGGASQVTIKAKEQDFVPKEVHEELHIAGEPLHKLAHSVLVYVDQLVINTSFQLQETRVSCAFNKYTT